MDTKIEGERVVAANINTDITSFTSLTLSKPSKWGGIERQLGRPYIKIKINPSTASEKDPSRAYFVEKFTKTQSFHEHISFAALLNFLCTCIGHLFCNCIIRTPYSEISYYTDEIGKVTRHCRSLTVYTPVSPPRSKAVASLSTAVAACPAPYSRENAVISCRTAIMEDNFAAPLHKQHILPEGTAVPFLVRLGIMTDKGKVVQNKYDKFRQINRFLEFVDDIVRTLGILAPAASIFTAPANGTIECSDSGIASAAANSNNTPPIQQPFTVVDFGCGKAYLTFAIHYYLTKYCRLPVDITGIDLKADVVDYCTAVAKELQCRGLHFMTGDIAHYNSTAALDLVVALHACDTATDEALYFAIKAGSKAILSAPCCQHEVNAELSVPKEVSPFAPLLKHGLLRERFAALATDAIRAEYLEAAGYSVQLLEFIDAQHTPKNLLIRAVKKISKAGGAVQHSDTAKQHSTGTIQCNSLATKRALAEAKALTDALGIHIRLGDKLFSPQCSSS